MSGASGFSIAFKTESVGWTATRLAAVIVERNRPARRSSEPRGWLRRLFRRRPAAPAPQVPPVHYDEDEREVRVLDRRWPVPRGELALAMVIDFRGGGDGVAPVITTRTFAAPTVAREPFKADPRASRRKNMKRLGEVAARRRSAEEEAWRAALRADPDLMAFLGAETAALVMPRR